MEWTDLKVLKDGDESLSPTNKSSEKGKKTAGNSGKGDRSRPNATAPKATTELVDAKLMFGNPINCTMKIILDARQDLHQNTTRAKSQAIRAGIIPPEVQIRLACTDVEGDRCIIATDMEMNELLTRCEAISQHSPRTAQNTAPSIHVQLYA